MKSATFFLVLIFNTSCFISKVKQSQPIINVYDYYWNRFRENNAFSYNVNELTDRAILPNFILPDSLGGLDVRGEVHFAALIDHDKQIKSIAIDDIFLWNSKSSNSVIKNNNPFISWAAWGNKQEPVNDLYYLRLKEFLLHDAIPVIPISQVDNYISPGQYITYGWLTIGKRMN